MQILLRGNIFSFCGAHNGIAAGESFFLVGLLLGKYQILYLSGYGIKRCVFDLRCLFQRKERLLIFSYACEDTANLLTIARNQSKLKIRCHS